MKIRLLIEELASVVIGPPTVGARIRCHLALAYGRRAIAEATRIGAEPDTREAWRALVDIARLAAEPTADELRGLRGPYRALMRALGFRYDGTGSGRIVWDGDAENEDLIAFLALACTPAPVTSL